MYVTFVYGVNLQLLPLFTWPFIDDVNLHIVVLLYVTFVNDAFTCHCSNSHPGMKAQVDW